MANGDTDLKLSNVHEILALAAAEEIPKGEREKPLKNYPYRCDEDIYKKATDICIRHDTTASEFVRKCLEILVSDYQE